MLGRQRDIAAHVERAILGDELAADLADRTDMLEQLMSGLSAQVQAQFTTIAAHAEIARHQMASAREEARADLDRTRDALIELMERVRAECRPVQPSRGAERQVDELARQLADVSAQLAVVTSRQRELTDTMAALLDGLLAERAT